MNDYLEHYGVKGMKWRHHKMPIYNVRQYKERRSKEADVRNKKRRKNQLGNGVYLIDRNNGYDFKNTKTGATSKARYDGGKKRWYINYEYALQKARTGRGYDRSINSINKSSKKTISRGKTTVKRLLSK